MKKNYRIYFKFFFIILFFIFLSACCGIIPTIYTITSSVGAGGSISPAGAVTVNKGANQTFTLTPDEGYQIYNVLVDGVSIGALSTYTFSIIQQDHTISANFTQNVTPIAPVIIKYIITATADIGGSITPKGSVKVTKGSKRTFSITPYAYYQIADVLVDGISVGPVDTFTFTNVKKNHTIFANFLARKVINITTSVDYDSIQTAIDASNFGDTIIVCPGTYEENIVFDGKHITVKSVDSSDPTTVDATIIDGVGGSVVRFTGGDMSTLEGFTIQNGYYYIGGGIHIYNSSPIIIGNTITNNKAITLGGGIFMDSSSAAITGNTITKNVAEKGGGGICMSYCTPSIIEYNTISGNKATKYGGGIHIFESDSIVSENSITDNNAMNGSGIYVFFSSPTIRNNLITSNSATSNGGGINVTSYSHPTINNNSISSNTTTGFGGGIYVSSSADFSMCDLLPDIPRPAGWGSSGDSDYRNNIPIDNNETAEPIDGPAENTFSGNRHGDPLEYTEGAHVYFKTD